MAAKPTLDRPRRRVIASLGLSVAAVAIAIVVAELSLPWFISYAPYPASYSDDYAFTLAPSASVTLSTQVGTRVEYKINRFGYRGPERESLAKTGAKRVLLLGDSYTLGWSIPEQETFAGILRSRGYDVINAAYHAGQAPDSYYSYMLREGAALKPDIVVLMICTANDIQDISENHWTEIDSKGLPIKVVTTRKYTGMRNMLLRMEPYVDSRPWLAKSEIARLIVRQLADRDLDRLNSLPKMSGEDAWQKFAVLLKGIEEVSGAKVITTAILWPKGHYWIDGFPLADQDRVLRLARSTMSGPVIDLQSLPIEQYLPLDGHFNEAGHRTVADILAKAIEQ